MKARYIGLLVLGAALAGGLAVRMTEVQPAPIASTEAIHPVPGPAPALKPEPQPAPAPVSKKPSPIPRRVRSDTAPAPVYEAPPKPAVRKNEPILTAKAARPAYVPPVPYARPPVVLTKPQPEISSTPEVQPEPKPAPEPKRAPQRQVTLQAGMTVPVRLAESISTDRRVAGDTFDGSLAEPLIADGLVIAERGARVRGRIVGTQRITQKDGHLKGTGLDLELTSIETSDGQSVEIPTEPLSKRGDPAYGKPAVASSQTVIWFRLTSQVTIKERQL